MRGRTLFWVIGFVVAGTHPAMGVQDDPALEAAIREMRRGMRLSDDPALVQRADFNGDGRDDVCAVLEGDDRNSLVVLQASNGGYQLYPLYARLPAGPYRLRIAPPGRHRVLGPSETIRTTTPAIELIFTNRSSAMYVWSGRRYAVHATDNFR